jgi:hypothetical protein
MTIIRSYNFSKFKRLFAKGLNPFKIQTRFKLDLLMNFIIQNPESFGSWANRKVWKILDFRNTVVVNFKV